MQKRKLLTSDQELTEKLRELKLAGGDLPALGALAVSDRTELTVALKSLGFKGLRTRQELEHTCARYLVQCLRWQHVRSSRLRAQPETEA